MSNSKPIKIYVIRLKQSEIALIAESLHLLAQVAAQNDEADECLRLMELKERVLAQASKSERRG